MNFATKQMGTTVVATTTVLPTNNKETAKEFSCVVLSFSAGELAQASGRTKDAAKKWKAGEALPDTWSTFKMAQTIPEIRMWALAKMGIGDAEFIDPQVRTIAQAAVHQILSDRSPASDAFRAELAKLAERYRHG